MEQARTAINQTQAENFTINAQNNELNLDKGNIRLGRRLYFIFAIIFPFISFWMLSKISTLLSQPDIVASLFINWILALTTLSIIALVVRLTIHRCYDFGASKWYAAFSIIPFTPLLFVLIPGHSDKNNYGNKPKSPFFIVKNSVNFSIIKINDFLKY